MITSDILEVENLNAVYRTEMYGIQREVKVINEINLNLKKNEVYGIAGESGSGKTTLVKLLTGTHRAPLMVLGGQVHYGFTSLDKKTDILNCPRKELDGIRWKNISYIMQGSMNVLNPVRKVYYSFVDFAFKHLGIEDKVIFKKHVEDYLAKLRLPPEVLNSYPHELSGGMRQRVIIALSTICNPDIIIADEPTTALDVVVQRESLNLIRDIQKIQKNTVLLITHDMAVHANIADRISIMYAGRIVEEAPTREIFYSPRHPYTKHLIGSLPRIGDSSHREGLKGNPPNLANPITGCPFHPRCPNATQVCAEQNPPMEIIGKDHRTACFHKES
jgi:peptide/nickel transport system ATP-binding protein